MLLWYWCSQVLTKMENQVNCMLAPLYSDSLNMITSVKATFCSFKIDFYWEKFSCSARKKSIWRSRLVPWSRSRVSHRRRTSSGWHWWQKHGWKALFAGSWSLSSQAPSTYPPSASPSTSASVSLRTFMSSPVPDVLHSDMYCVVNYWSPGDLTAFFLLFSQIYGLYEAIYKVHCRWRKWICWYF